MTMIDKPRPLSKDESVVGQPADYCTGGENPGVTAEQIAKPDPSTIESASRYSEHEDLVMKAKG